MNTDTSSQKESFPTNGGGDDDEMEEFPKKYFRLHFLPLAEGEHLSWDMPDQRPEKIPLKDMLKFSPLVLSSTKCKGYNISTDVNFYADLISGHLVCTNVIFCANHVFCLSILAFKVTVLFLSYEKIIFVL